MPDREALIKAIACRKTAHKRCGNPCERIGACEYVSLLISPDGEPYGPSYCDIERLCDDAIDLLREQEAARPSPSVFTPGMYSCGDCGEDLPEAENGCKPNYCPNCGREVKWDCD